MTIPNAMSIFRILLIPVFCVLFLNAGEAEYNMYLLSGGVLLLSGLTDLFDGYIARKLNQVTDLGKLLDPVADKLTLAAVLVCIWVKFKNVYQVLTPVFIIMLVKEVVMMLGGLILMLLGKKMVKAQWWGKVATAAFYVLMTAAIVFYACFPNYENTMYIVTAMICTSALIMVIALAFYVRLGIQILNGKGPEDDDEVIHVDKLKGGHGA